MKGKKLSRKERYALTALQSEDPHAYVSHHMRNKLVAMGLVSVFPRTHQLTAQGRRALIDDGVEIDETKTPRITCPLEETVLELRKDVERLDALYSACVKKDEDSPEKNGQYLLSGAIKKNTEIYDSCPDCCGEIGAVYKEPDGFFWNECLQCQRRWYAKEQE